MDHPVAASNNAVAVTARTVLPPGSVAVTVAASAPARSREAEARRARRSRGARVTLALALLVLGSAAAALAVFAMALPPADSRILGSCAPTDAEAAALREASELLLLSASAQVLASVAALLAPAAAPIAYFAYALGWLTAYRAVDVVSMLVSCHGGASGALAFHFWFFFAVLLATLLVGLFTATR
ncbi:unnamed protein product [Urochloa humidicola]